MKVRYDPKSKILYILIREGDVTDTDEVTEDVWVEYDEKGDIMGIEIWNAEISNKLLFENQKNYKTQYTQRH
ncbi:DUF2283 domain-containing protein [Thermococcus chitonophagus]|uniref:DUF2283 domain-containing protein n=1 Tax=Thermococcus chitonophagus TaxID=54262 RepID=UPI0008394238|nr:DUF2283 domain-containing protein [Thermococcus chitonophagus]